MANTGVEGFILAKTGYGIPGLEIHAVDFDPILSEDFLGKTTTDNNGYFKISYSPDTYRQWFDRNPDIVVRVYGPGLRLLHETSEFSDVKDTILNIAAVIDKNNVDGWLVTNATLDPTIGDPVWLTQGNQIEWLIDGATVFPKLTEAVNKAKRSINFMNLKFSVDNVITNFKFKVGKNFENLKDGDEVQGEQIQKIIKDKASNGIPAHVLVWDLWDDPLFDDADTADEVKHYYLGSRVETRFFFFFSSFLHAKVVVVDGESAFVIGSPISQGYFSDDCHLIHDARHGGSLFHDVSLLVTGPAVEHVDRTFTTVWNAADSSASALSPATGQQKQQGDQIAAVQVVRTLPGGMFGKSIPHGETGVLEAYQRAIANANDFIYIEDQYFISPEIVTALIQRMKKIPGLEAIIVLNVYPDIPGYAQKQIPCIKQLQEAVGVDRLGIFTLWSCDEKKTPFEIKPIYVHSKTAIVDDKWATVGSANIDGASLNQLQTGTVIEGAIDDLHGWKKILVKILLNPFILPLILLITIPITFPPYLHLLPDIISLAKNVIVRATQHANPQRSEQPPRFIELNLVIYNNVAGQPATELVVQLRKKLWSEHLGLPIQDLPEKPPKGGWVALWKQRAAEKLDAIKKGKRHPAKILEWKPEIDPEKSLRALDIKTRNLKVREEADKFDFKTSKWGKEH